MKRHISLAAIVFLLATPLFAMWAEISLEKLVADSDLIVVGTLHSGEEDSRGIGDGQILIEEIITTGAKTLDGTASKPGDNLKIHWADSWACASGMHRGRENKKGVYLLKVEPDGTVNAGYPGRFAQLSEIREIRAILKSKKGKKSARVDVVEVKNEPISLPLSETYSLDTFVDTSIDTFTDTSVDQFANLRAALAFFLSVGLYFILYKSRFRIR